MTNVGKRICTALTAVLAVVCLLFGGISVVSGHAEGVVTVDYSTGGVELTGGGKKITAVTDPYTNVETTASGMLTGNVWKDNAVGASVNIIYTARWYKTTSGRKGAFTEYTVETDGNGYKITGINNSGNGDSYIPVGGFVLSAPNSTAFGAVGDTVALGGNKFPIPTMAVESDKGMRVAVDALNANRSQPMVVYYDYQTGDKTGTNQYGTELVATYDEESNSFIVNRFRAFGEGDASGIAIPASSFALSAYGEGYRGILEEGKRFHVGDKLSMVGFDFIRFGNSVSYAYNFIDPDLESNPKGWDSATNAPFPAYRGEEQLNIYTDGWNYNGAAGTGANVYGFEVAVNADGVVVERNVTISKIPEGGFAMSGHGKGRDFLRASVPMGASITLNEESKTFTVTTTLNSFYTNVAGTLNSAVESARVKLAQLYDIDADAVEALVDRADKALASLQALKEEIERNESGWDSAERTRKLMQFNTKQLEVENLAYSVIAASMESKPVAARAVWHRPTEQSLTAIRDSLNVYKDCGINLVFVESFFGGMSMFRSETVPYHADFASANYGEYADYLTAFASEANKLGIEVHAWVEDFYVGINPNLGVYKQHPEWVLYNDDGSITQRNEGGAYIFLDPANKEVQDYLIAFYNELLDKVPYISGLNLDYIRYPVSSAEQDTGYTVTAMRGFASSVGVTLQETDYAKMVKEFRQKFFNSDYTLDAEVNKTRWIAYRTDIITSFVERITKEVKGTHKGLILSTAVFPSLTTSINTKMQDWQTWFKNGWIDVATPMAYYNDPSDVLLYVKDMILMAGSNCYYYAGLASSYSGLPAYENANQIDAAYLAGSNGYVIFCSTQILGHDDVQQVLKSGVNSREAVLPHASLAEILQAYADRISDRAERLYIPAGGMTEEKLSALLAQFDEIAKTDLSASKGIAEAETALKALAKNYAKYAVGFSGRRLSETLNEIVSLVDLKLSRSMIDSGVWDPAVTPVRPSADGTVTPPDQPKPDQPNEPNEPKNQTGLIVGLSVGAAVLVVAAVAVGVTLTARKKTVNGKNSDDKENK